MISPYDAADCPCPKCGKYTLNAFGPIGKPPEQWRCRTCGKRSTLEEVSASCSSDDE
jgi:transposase-like protein